jgi:hypothetical protein
VVVVEIAVEVVVEGGGAVVVESAAATAVVTGAVTGPEQAVSTRLALINTAGHAAKR